MQHNTHTVAGVACHATEGLVCCWCSLPCNRRSGSSPFFEGLLHHPPQRGEDSVASVCVTLLSMAPCLKIMHPAAVRHSCSTPFLHLSSYRCKIPSTMPQSSTGSAYWQDRTEQYTLEFWMAVKAAAAGSTTNRSLTAAECS